MPRPNRASRGRKRRRRKRHFPNMKKHLIFVLVAAAAQLLSCCTSPAELHTGSILQAAEQATVTDIRVFHRGKNSCIFSERLNTADAAALRDLILQGHYTDYKPTIICPPAPVPADVNICWTMPDGHCVTLNPENIWDESNEKLQKAMLAKDEDGYGSMAPDLVLPDAANERLLALPPLRRAIEIAREAENQ